MSEPIVSTPASPTTLAEIKSALTGISRDARVTLVFTDRKAYKSYSGLAHEIRREFSNTSILSLNYILSRHLEEIQVEHQRIYNSVMGEEYANVFPAAEDYAQNWFKDRKTGEDFTKYKKWSLGHCLELLVFNFFQAVIKCSIDVDMYIQNHRPEALIYFTSGDYIQDQVESSVDFDIFKKLFQRRCVPNGICFVETNSIAPAQKNTTSFWASFMKPSPPIKIGENEIRLPHGLYSVLKNLYLSAKNILALQRFLPSRINLFFASPATASYAGLNVINKILSSGNFNLMVWNGESKQTDVKNILPLFLPSYIRQELNSKSIRHQVREMFESCREKLKYSTLYDDFSIFEYYPFYFESLFLTYFPKLIAHGETVQKELKKNKVDAIISHTDHAIYERMTLLIGNELLIPTVSFQHGIELLIENSKLGHPSSSHYSLVWGKVNKKIRELKDGDQHHSEIVGCLIHPLSEPPNQEPVYSLAHPGTFLFIMNTGWQYKNDDRLTFLENEELVRICLQMIKSFPDKTLVLKPRLNDLQIPIYKKMVADANLPNVVINTQPIVPLLKACDLFLHVGSTAALEGLIFHKPGIQFLFSFEGRKTLKEKTKFNLLPFAQYNANLGLDRPNPETLANLVRSIYDSQEVRDRLRAGRKEFLRDFANLGGGDPADNFVKALRNIVASNSKV